MAPTLWQNNSYYLQGQYIHVFEFHLGNEKTKRNESLDISMGIFFLYIIKIFIIFPLRKQ